MIIVNWRSMKKWGILVALWLLYTPLAHAQAFMTTPEKLAFSCILVNFSCGALAGATVDTILFPLDTIKTYSHSFSGVIDQN